MRATERVVVALGSNLGDRERYLSVGRAGLDGLPDTELLAVSTVEETAPLGPPGQEHYLNQMALLETTLSPQALLRALQAIEDRAGRQRDARWGPRTLDLDIVRYGTARIASAELTIPHPELPNRPFWQRALEELDPDGS